MRIKRIAISLLIVSLACVYFSSVLPDPATAQSGTIRIDGFDNSSSIAQKRLEQQFLGIPSRDSAREHLRRLTAEPHVAGTKEGYETALYVRDEIRKYGLTAELKEYDVLLPYPLRPTVVELLAPRRQRLALKEDVLTEDPSSAHARIIPLFNGYSASGDVTGQIVYVNYGLPGDYEALSKLGVSVKGKIALARYGNSFRGVKAKVAEDQGALGLLIYSDPADDGYVQGDVYPKGPWRPASSAQRGSVQYIFQYPGDPLTPGQPSIPGVKRLPIGEATNLTRIPVQPLSYGDARKLLEPLRGPVRPKGFQGGLPFAYHVGGTEDVRVRLNTAMDYQIRKIWNVIARVEGQVENDRWVILGNHRDAWTFGAVDPGSGSTAMLEVARGFGQLLKQGWKPRRTVVLCSWDGEEYGLLGSTEWVEENAAELKTKAVAYLNMDSAVSGPNFAAASVPSLWNLIRAAAHEVVDPGSQKTVLQQWQERARSERQGAPGDQALDSPQRTTPKISPLGSGSDYTPFLQHLGIPSLDLSFGGDYGVYHSAFDSFYWMEHFGDPTFAYHAAAAQVWGIVALRLADAPALPLNYSDYAAQVREFFDDSMQAAKQTGLAGGLDQKPMHQALEDFSREAARLERTRQEILNQLDTDEQDLQSKIKLRQINDALIGAERALTDSRGLRGRPWYKHQIYAPGFYTGYAALPLPDFRQALDDGNEAEAQEALARVIQALKRASAALKL